MNIHNIPRDTSGEGKLLYIFSYKALIFTIIGAVIGYVFFSIFRVIGLGKIGLIIMGALAFIGFAIATFTVPKIRIFPFTEFIVGEKIDDCILRYIKFKQKRHINYTLFDTRKDYLEYPEGFEKNKEENLNG